MFSTPLASTPIVRPPAAGAAMGRRVDPPGQAADDGQAGAGEAAGQSFRLPQAVLRGMARADDAHGQSVAGIEPPAHKQHARRIGDLAQQAGIARVGLDEDVDVVFAAEGDFLGDVDFRAGGENPCGQFGADARQLAEFARCGGQHRPRRAEPPHQRLSRSRPDALDQYQPQGVDQFVIGRRAGGGVLGFGHGCTF